MIRIIIFLAIFTATAHAQLSQLEFEKEAESEPTAIPKAEPSIDPIKELTSDVLPKSAAEAEAMERAALEKLKNPQSSLTSSAQSSSSSAGEPIKKFDYIGGAVLLGAQHGCASIPPRLKGPYTDEGNDSAITSKASWPIPKNRDCASVTEEKSLLSKSLATKEVLHRFSGNSDYFDLATVNVCEPHCLAGFHLPLVSEVRAQEGLGVNFSVAESNGACRYILQKPKERPWKMVKVLSLICNCFEASKAKPVLDAQVLEK